MSKSLEKLLFVEDDESIAQVAVMILEDFGGFSVKHCDTGRKALDCLVEYAPQFILLDVVMPGMDGPETLERLRRIPMAKKIPVAFMTAKAQTHEQAIFRKLDVVGVIVKPFDPMALSGQITNLWALSQAA